MTHRSTQVFSMAEIYKRMTARLVYDAAVTPAPALTRRIDGLLTLISDNDTLEWPDDLAALSVNIVFGFPSVIWVII